MWKTVLKRLGAHTLMVAACALSLSALMTESRARDIGALGGGGGAPFRLACRPGDVMIGFNMRSGSALDAIVPICIGLNPQKTDWGSPAYEASGYVGGNGGNYQKIACKVGYVVRHLHVYMDANKIVNHIRITCADLDSNPGDWHDVVPGQIGGQAIGDLRFNCLDHEWEPEFTAGLAPLSTSSGCSARYFGRTAKPTRPRRSSRRKRANETVGSPVLSGTRLSPNTSIGVPD